MLKILAPHGISPKIVNTIRMMYKNTFALIMTSESNTDIFKTDYGVLQENPLTSLLFIIRLDYTLRASIFSLDELTLKRRERRRLHLEILGELAFADDISLMEDTINKAESIFHKIETATPSTGLFFNASKTKEFQSLCRVIFML